MVLRAALLLLSAAACVPSSRPPHLNVGAAPVVVALLREDPAAERAESASMLAPALRAELSLRNLDFTEPPASVLEALMPRQHTPQRLALLRAGEPAFVVLVEAEATFTSQINGRFRWNVRARLTLLPPGAALVEEIVSLPALLLFEHEREDDASRLSPLGRSRSISGHSPRASERNLSKSRSMPTGSTAVMPRT